MPRPDVGSTSRLMQRNRVLFPAPDGPMTAVIPSESRASDTPCKTDWPRVYCFVRSWICSVGPGDCGRSRILGRGFRLLQLLQSFLGEDLAGADGHLPDDVPVFLVVDGVEVRRAFQALGHLGRELEVEEGLLDLGH